MNFPTITTKETVRGLDALECCERARGFENNGDYSAAREELSRFWTRIGERPDVEGCGPRASAEILLRVGLLSCKIGSASQFEGALEFAKNLLTDSLSQFEQLGERNKEAEACFGLGLCSRHEGTYDNALTWFAEALGKADHTAVELKFRILLNRAIIEKDTGRWHDALSSHGELVKIHYSINNYSLLGTYHNEHGIVLEKLGAAEKNQAHLSRALAEYEEAKCQYQAAGHTRFLASSENNISCLLLKLGRLGEALEYVGRAITLAEAIRDKAYQAQFLDTKAQIWMALGDYVNAEKAAAASVRLLTIGGHQSLLAQSLTTHGVALARLGDRARALRAFGDAEEIAAHIGDKDSAGRAVLACLEEVGGLEIEARREAHSKINLYLSGTQDASITSRHLVCALKTLEQDTGLEFREGFSLPAYLQRVEREAIEQAYKEGGGTLTGAARLLGISPSCLNEKLKTKFPQIKKSLQTKTRQRQKREKEHMGQLTLLKGAGERGVDLIRLNDDSLSDRGINDGDRVVVRKRAEVGNGDLAVLRSRGKYFAGVYLKEKDGVCLAPANDDFDEWFFERGSYELVGKVVGYIKSTDLGTVHPV